MKGSGAKVLIADDSERIRKRLAKLILATSGGAEIRESADVQTTIEKLLSDPPQILVLDLHMPGGSGLEALECIQRRNLPVVAIVLTNYASEGNRKKCLSMGASFVYDKSTQFEEALLALKRLQSADGLPERASHE
jgi:DNA-binding NarL/FixJ family response regulator